MLVSNSRDVSTEKDLMVAMTRQIEHSRDSYLGKSTISGRLVS
jgi:hypothetical protein